MPITDKQKAHNKELRACARTERVVYAVIDDYEAGNISAGAKKVRALTKLDIIDLLNVTDIFCHDVHQLNDFMIFVREALATKESK